MAKENESDARDERTSGIIEIDEGYAILVMPIDYALAKKVKSKKTGDISYKAIAYVGSIEKCLKEYIRVNLHSELEGVERITVSEAVSVIQTVVGRCESAIRGAFPEYKVVRA